MRIRRFLGPVIAAVVLLGTSASPHAQGLALGWTRFEQYVEALRKQVGIPGMTVVVIKDRQIAWERGFGFQDAEASIRATPDTAYHVVGLTQTMSAALLLDCASRARLQLDLPAALFSEAIPEPGVTLRHLLTHTSEAPVGSAFKLDLTRYAAITPAIERCWAAKAFREILTDAVLDRFALIDSVPGQDVTTLELPPAPVLLLQPQTFDAQKLARYRSVLDRLARPYRVDRNRRATPVTYPSSSLDAASGLVTTARDLARFDMALDDFVLLNEETVEAMWTPPWPVSPVQAALGTTARPLPHALGWFVQSYQGQRVIWQFGRWPDVTSSLIVKVPAQNLTVILLANSDGLASSAQFESGDISSSLFGLLILRFFL
jgi:CubicO group peptidase (beta-lactamase class C family)